MPFSFGKFRTFQLFTKIAVPLIRMLVFFANIQDLHVFLFSIRQVQLFSQFVTDWPKKISFIKKKKKKKMTFNESFDSTNYFNKLTS